MWQCPNGDTPSEYVVGVDAEYDPDGIGVLVYPDGRATNRWADGTAGIGRERAEMAEDAEDATCPDCGEEARWIR